MRESIWIPQTDALFSESWRCIQCRLAVISCIGLICSQSSLSQICQCTSLVDRELLSALYLYSLQVTAFSVITQSGVTGTLPTGVQFTFSGPPSYDEASSIDSSGATAPPSPASSNESAPESSPESAIQSDVASASASGASQVSEDHATLTTHRYSMYGLMPRPCYQRPL